MIDNSPSHQVPEHAKCSWHHALSHTSWGPLQEVEVVGGSKSTRSSPVESVHHHANVWPFSTAAQSW
jgi:hypothetical protein